MLICALKQRVKSIFPKLPSCTTNEEEGYLEKNPSTVTDKNYGELIDTGVANNEHVPGSR